MFGIQGHIAVHQLAKKADDSKRLFVERAAAQYELGRMYDVGDVVKADFGKAMYHYEMAAFFGNADAQYALGLKYQVGLSNERDVAKAIKYYEQAAAQNHGGAQSNLGSLYNNGEHVPKDVFKAREYFEAAANNKEPHAQQMLAYMYLAGEVVPKNYVQAAKWLIEADKNGSGTTWGSLPNLYRQCDRDIQAALKNPGRQEFDQASDPDLAAKYTVVKMIGKYHAECVAAGVKRPFAYGSLHQH